MVQMVTLSQVELNSYMATTSESINNQAIMNKYLAYSLILMIMITFVLYGIIVFIPIPFTGWAEDEIIDNL